MIILNLFGKYIIIKFVWINNNKWYCNVSKYFLRILFKILSRFDILFDDNFSIVFWSYFMMIVIWYNIDLEYSMIFEILLIFINESFGKNIFWNFIIFSSLIIVSFYKIEIYIKIEIILIYFLICHWFFINWIYEDFSYFKFYLFYEIYIFS